MKITIRLNDDLLAQTKKAALNSNRTLTAFVEDALRQALSHKKTPPKRRRIRLISSGKGGLRPGVNLDSTAELLDIMGGQPPRMQADTMGKPARYTSTNSALVPRPTWNDRL